MQHQQINLQRTRISRLILLMATILVICGCSENNRTQPEAMLNEDLNCADNSKGEFRRWGGIDENGWSHSCTMNHGKYHVWRYNVLAIEGQFNYGKKAGEWMYRDKNGEITKVVTYKDGEIISEERE